MITLVIAAPQSGSGKTTITLGIMETLKRRGLTVAPFKVGPDFIDPGYHRLITGRPSINLDGWMCSDAFVRGTFALHAAGADVAVIEGVMGLFDGISGSSDEGSTAQVARLIGAPVILVVDARSQARSAAALIKGFAGFDPRLWLAGVIFNNVGSDNHSRILREAVASLSADIPVFGCIPRNEEVSIPSRHLGLVTAEDNPLTPDFMDHLAEVMERNLDLDGLLAAVKGQSLAPAWRAAPTNGSVRLAVARDAAFCFVYDDTLRLLREAGAEIAEFSPLADRQLPGNISGIYLPGGYPELFADSLSANESMKAAIRDAIEAGMPVYAECGGFIYLTDGLADNSNTLSQGERVAEDRVRVQGFVGIFPVTTRMLPRRKALGYREVELAADSFLGPAGMVARGHEFHYSEIGEMPEEIERVYRVRRHGADLGEEGFRYRNCLASYIHLHFGSNPGLASSLVSACQAFAGETGSHQGISPHPASGYPLPRGEGYSPLALVGEGRG
jgi:cobyrinic acid a,c-diamide synthase